MDMVESRVLLFQASLRDVFSLAGRSGPALGLRAKHPTQALQSKEQAPSPHFCAMLHARRAQPQGMNRANWCG